MDRKKSKRKGGNAKLPKKKKKVYQNQNDFQISPCQFTLWKFYFWKNNHSIIFIMLEIKMYLLYRKAPTTNLCNSLLMYFKRSLQICTKDHMENNVVSCWDYIINLINVTIKPIIKLRNWASLAYIIIVSVQILYFPSLA